MNKKRNNYSEEFKRKVVEECKADDVTINQLASKYGISRYAISNWRKQYDVDSCEAQYKKPYSEAFKCKILDEYEEGELSIPQLADKHGVNRRTIQDWRKKRINPASSKAQNEPYSEEIKRKVVDYYFAGATFKAIYEKYGINNKAVSKWVEEYGVHKAREELGKKPNEPMTLLEEKWGITKANMKARGIPTRSGKTPEEHFAECADRKAPMKLSQVSKDR